MEEFRLAKILNFFFENPYEEIYLRDLSRKLKMSPFAIKKYADFLVKNNLIRDEKRANLRFFKANMSGLLFKHLKISWSIHKIVKSGLMSMIKSKSQSISSITLFGSAARGEDDKNSDIDIVVIGNLKELDISEAEKKIKKRINLHVFRWSEWKKQLKLNTAFYSDIIINGISLYGDLPLVI